MCLVERFQHTNDSPDRSEEEEIQVTETEIKKKRFIWEEERKRDSSGGGERICAFVTESLCTGPTNKRA